VHEPLPVLLGVLHERAREHLERQHHAVVSGGRRDLCKQSGVLRRYLAEQRDALGRYERAPVDELAQARGEPVRGAGQRVPSPAVPDQRDIVQIVALDQEA
jgi:hypothetical protein